jgi:hypothetical protein
VLSSVLSSGVEDIGAQGKVSAVEDIDAHASAVRGDAENPKV